MSSDNDKPITREEIKELIESYLSDYVREEDLERLIEKKIQDHEREKKEMWRDDKPF